MTVLGAGASASCGYPLAYDFLPRLEAYSKVVGENCPRLKIAIDHVVSRSRELNCLTPDDLAFRVHQLRAGGVPRYRAALRTLIYARIATDALFLHLEHQLSDQAMGRYRDYWHEAAGPLSDDWYSRFPDTKHRLLSFNYDRLPEIALLRYFPVLTGMAAGNLKDIYGPAVLNTGLSYAPEAGCEFAADSFSYLKLHGSVGIEPFGKNEIAWDFGHRFRHYAPFGAEPTASINDGMYFHENQLDPDGMPAWKTGPLVVFPTDKQRIEAGGQDYNLDQHVGAVRRQATAIFEDARVIRIVGYSFAAPDRPWLISMLRVAPDDVEIVIKNRQPQELVDVLTQDEGFANVSGRTETW